MDAALNALYVYTAEVYYSPELRVNLRVKSLIRRALHVNLVMFL